MNTVFPRSISTNPTFTASSDVRINTLLEKPYDTSVKQKWVLQWENEFPKDDSQVGQGLGYGCGVESDSIFDGQREGTMSSQVDLVHLMMSERVIEELWHGRTSDVSGTDIIGMSESLYLGRKC